MTIKHLRIFVTVCDCGSVTAAAARLFMTQPAVSLAIKELEEHYGIKLFDRLSRRLNATCDAERLLSYAAHVVGLFDKMEAAMKNADAAGTLRAGCSMSIGACLMPEYALKFQRQYPKTRLMVTVDSSEAIEGKVKTGELDFGLIEGVTHYEQIIAERFMEDELTAICAAGHPFSQRGEATLADFLSQPLLLRERGSGTRELFEGAAAGMRIDPLWESASTNALIRAVACGNGVSVLPRRLVADAVCSGRVCEVRLSGVSLKRAFYRIYHKNKYLSERIKAFFALT